MRVSQSRLKTWMNCPYKYELIYRRNVIRRYEDLPIATGSLIHIGFEAALRAHMKGSSEEEILSAGDKAISENEATSGGDQEEISTVIGIFRRSFEKIGILKGRWETLRDTQGKECIEYEINSPLGGHQVVGVVDWIARDTDSGLAWLIDFKTRKLPKSVYYDEFQFQLPIYQVVLNETGILGQKIYGSAIYEIRSKPEALPTLTKAGKLSRKLGAMNPESLIEFCQKNEISQSEYSPLLEKLRPMDTFYKHYRSDRELNAIAEDFVAAANQLENANRFPRNLDPMSCQRCGYKAFCQAEMKNYDTEELMKVMFKFKEDK